MANNPYVNKVVYDGDTLIDITDTTAVASDVAQGKYFYKADGSKTLGTASGGVTDVTVGGTSVVNAQGVAQLNSDFKVFNLHSDGGHETPSTLAEVTAAYNYWFDHSDSTLIFVDDYLILSCEVRNYKYYFEGSPSFDTRQGYEYVELKHYSCNYSDPSSHLVYEYLDLQPELVSGSNIKTINNQSLLGSGNIDIQGGSGVSDVTVGGTSIVNAQGVAELNSDFKIFQLTSSTGGTPSTYAQIREAYNYYLAHPTSTFIYIDGYHIAYSHDNTTDKKMFFYIGTTMPNMLPNNPNMMLLYYECDYTTTSTATLESAGDIISQPSKTGDLINNGDGTQGSLYATQTWVQNYIASLDGNNTGY